MTNYQEYFNGAVTAKSLATADKDGNPNVCLCGSAVMLGEKTIGGRPAGAGVHRHAQFFGDRLGIIDRDGHELPATLP